MSFYLESHVLALKGGGGRGGGLHSPVFHPAVGLRFIRSVLKTLDLIGHYVVSSAVRNINHSSHL